MTSERIKEIQQQTAYPDSISVQQALLQVWNECSQLPQQELSDDVKQLILLLESRSQELENEATSKNNIEGLTTEQTRDVKIKKIGESQGINLCVLQIKNLLKLK